MAMSAVTANPARSVAPRRRRASVVAIIQARMGSSRLPGKALMPLNGRPVLEHVIARLGACPQVDRVLVATSTARQDEPIARFCRERRIACFRGSESDVLDRYYQAAKPLKRPGRTLAIVRITADCPLIDPVIVGEVIERFHRHGDRIDYVSNTLQRTFPDGLDVEVVSFDALKRAWQEATDLADREHVTRFLYRPREGRPAPFRLDEVRAARPLGHLRWTVDYPEDLQIMNRMLQDLEGPRTPQPGMDAMVAWTAAHPEALQHMLRAFTAAHRRKRLRRSIELLTRAEALIPAATQTLSKRPSQFARGLTPVFVRRASGCRIEDVDGNRYLDYGMALGAATLGYAHPDVVEAVRAQAGEGSIYTLPHELEVAVAEQLTHIIPCAEMVRFAKNGSDATAGAVRLARAHTGRERVAVCGYHGAQDWYIGTTSWHAGVPEAVRGLSHTFPYNRLDALEALFATHANEFAAVILEPVSVAPPAEGFLQGVVDLAHRHGALVIFDEIVTGFRFRLGGAQELFNVMPDLACFGKAMANGLPISAVVGRREVMKTFERVFFSFTFGGETLSLAAAQATIKVMQTRRVIEHLWKVGGRLQDGCRALIKELELGPHVQCQGYPPRHVLKFLDRDGRDWLALKTLFMQEAVKRGILTTGAHVLSLAHRPQDIDATIAQYQAIFRILQDAIAHGDVERRLQVEVVEPVFRPL